MNILCFNQMEINFMVRINDHVFLQYWASYELFFTPEVQRSKVDWCASKCMCLLPPLLYDAKAGLNCLLSSLISRTAFHNHICNLSDVGLKWSRTTFLRWHYCSVNCAHVHIIGCCWQLEHWNIARIWGTVYYGKHQMEEKREAGQPFSAAPPVYFTIWFHHSRQIPRLPDSVNEFLVWHIYYCTRPS